MNPDRPADDLIRLYSGYLILSTVTGIYIVARPVEGGWRAHVEFESVEAAKQAIDMRWEEYNKWVDDARARGRVTAPAPEVKGKATRFDQ